MKQEQKLLTRDAFREAVFARDNNKCVICFLPAADAHHIFERRLWPDGGYYLDNGASLCPSCHIKAEQTTLSVEEVRAAAKIITRIVPPHLYPDEQIDKWGNPVLVNGTRYMGELFDDLSVQKVLGEGGVLNLFVRHVKYPRTLHLPYSPSAKAKDERTMTDLLALESQHFVVTAKLDGENTTMYSDFIHARSLDYAPHPSRNWVKKLHADIGWQIPPGWRVCGENVYAKHSIHYKNLDSYFYVFSVWNDRNTCLSWQDTRDWADLLGLETVPVLFDGIYDELTISKIEPRNFDGDECEGYVVRRASEFHFKEFKKQVAQWVRKDHVQTHAFWRTAQVIPNGILK